MADPWTPAENAALVDSYMKAWCAEISGHRPSMRQFLENARKSVGPARNDNALRRKAYNVSAALDEAGLPHLRGFPPQANRQKSLDQVVLKALQATDMPTLIEQAAARPVGPAETEMPKTLQQVTPPSLGNRPQVPRAVRTAVKRDYSQLEEANRSLGTAGEQLVAEDYRRQLREVGRHDLAELVEHVAHTQGDGLGYDVLAYEADGARIYLEVKTTRGPRSTPFFISSAEVEASEELGQAYRLVRVFDYESSTGAKCYVLPGPVRASCALTATAYSALPV